MTAADRLNAMQQRCDAATEGPWEEEWRQIPGADGYEGSDHGRVRSYYLGGNHAKKRSPHPRVLARSTSRRYPTVSIKFDGATSYSTQRVHRLVMLAFVGPCPEGLEVAHLNGDPGDARLSNLRYVTHAENESHKRHHGTLGVGERNSQAVLLGWQVAEIRYLASKGVARQKIAALFDLRQKYVSEVLSGRVWAHEEKRDEVAS